MELPIPTHLQKYFIPLGDENTEYNVTGQIRCDCGCNNFEIWQSNNQEIVKLICSDCGKEILLFDAGKHGWNGFVCKDDFLDRTQPFCKYICQKCQNSIYKVTVTISSQGKQDFINECVSNDDLFTPDDWVDGFEWINISLFCAKCQYVEKDWLDFETM